MGVAAAPDLGTLNAPEPLAEQYDLGAFNSGEATLDDWLRRRARANQASGASRTYVVAQGQVVVGYYSLAPGAIALIDAPPRARRNMPDAIPMTILGQLAVDTAWQGKRLGRLLLRDAILRTEQAAAIIGVRGLLVHALSLAAKRFYEGSGFCESPNRPMTLVVTLQDARAALDAADSYQAP
jgi:GNAT superfamily N-acetyltransferase